MNTDRLLILLIVGTGLVVLVGGWAGGLVRAEATGFEEIALRVGIGAVFFLALLGAWYMFGRMDSESA